MSLHKIQKRKRRKKKRIAKVLLKYTTRWRASTECEQTQQQIIKLFTHLANISRSLAKFSEREKEMCFSYPSSQTYFRRRKSEISISTVSTVTNTIPPWKGERRNFPRHLSHLLHYDLVLSGTLHPLLQAIWSLWLHLWILETTP